MDWPVIKARFPDVSPAYLGYADRAATRFDISLNSLLDSLLEHGCMWLKREGKTYYITFVL